MFKNSFAQTLEAGFSYTRQRPTLVSRPRLLAWSSSAAELVGLLPSDELTQVLAGNKLLPGMDPIATRYGGHQFGHWAGQLGDGRAILLGEKNGWEVQLKGAGPTPYSRRADGRAVLRSSLREYLCSEAMHFLGVPTTRALALVGTGEAVVRDMFYDGHPAPEPGAICTRLSPSFLRFGHFEIHAAMGESPQLKKLLEYTLGFYPGHTLESFFNELCVRTAQLMVEWQRVGFVHGVMNTDNMSVLGLTIDYGPYGWLDVYDPEWTPNTTDATHRRYRFSQQPSIALWNLHRLSQALGSLGADLRPALENYRSIFFQGWQAMQARKLGLRKVETEMVVKLDEILRQQETDMTIFYRELSNLTERGLPDEAFYQPLRDDVRENLEIWFSRWRRQLQREGRSLEEVRTEMNQNNPVFIPRNYLAQEAIDALNLGDPSKLMALEAALQTPYEMNSQTRAFWGKRPEWARTKPGCAALSCSS